MPSFLLFLALALTLSLPTHAQPAYANDEIRRLSFQGIPRQYELYRPPQTQNAPAPLVVVLHGIYQDLTVTHRWIPIEQTADAHDFVVAYPQAFEKWGYWPGAGVTVPGHPETPVDDVGFVASVVEALIAERIADPARVYVTGVSRGALLTWSLACARPDLFAAAAPLSSGMIAWQQDHCFPSRLIPLLAIAGTEDPQQEYDGFLSALPTPRLLSVPESMAVWWRLAGCTEEVFTDLPKHDPNDPTRIQRFEWTKCGRDIPIILDRVNGAGHEPPSRTAILPDPYPDVGTRSRQMETAEELWSFFSTGKPLTEP